MLMLNRNEPMPSACFRLWSNESTLLLFDPWESWLYSKYMSFNLALLTDLLSIFCEVTPSEFPMIPLMISKYWLRPWPGAARQRAIILTNVDLDPQRRVPSVGLNVLTRV